MIVAAKNQAKARLDASNDRMIDRQIAFIENDSFSELRLSAKAVDSMVRYEPESRPIGRNAMPAHLERMCCTPLLTPDEERQLFKAMNFLKYRAELLRSSLNKKRPSKKTTREMESALQMSRRIRDRIITSNIRLVVSIVKKYTDSICTFDDLLSEGVGSLMNAVEKFDFDRGYRFSTYATSAVRRDLYRLIQKLHRDRGRYATGANELLEQTWSKPENLLRTETVLTKIDTRIADLMQTLDERELFIVSARYGFIDLGSKPTFQRLGQELGVSKERVRQLEMRAVNKLQKLAIETKLASIF